MIDAPLAVAFGAGMLATVNPCGFAMLPAYLTYFLGDVGPDGKVTDSGVGVVRALGVGAAVSAGFMSLFAVAGILLSWLSVGVYDIAPWITMVIALGLVVLGIAMLAGWEPVVSLPHLEKGGRDRTFRSMYLFGVSYAIASLGCTLPVFVATVSGTMRRHDTLSGIVVYVAYGLGMAVVLMSLTVAIAGRAPRSCGPCAASCPTCRASPGPSCWSRASTSAGTGCSRCARATAARRCRAAGR